MEITLSKKRRGRLAPIHDVLDRLGFREAFIPSTERDEWCDNVTFRGERGHMAQMYNITEETTNFLRMQWLNKEAFHLSHSAVLSQKPHVSADIARQFRGVLQTQGFAGAELIETLTDTMFLELGWNIVLHAARVRTRRRCPYCCGQITRRHDVTSRGFVPEITFCIADAGRGIPATLRDVYRKKLTPERDYRRKYGVSENAAIVRFALDRDSTSRATCSLRTGQGGVPQGLAHVAAALGESGRQMSLRADGGAVDLTKAALKARSRRPKICSSMFRFLELRSLVHFAISEADGNAIANTRA